MSSSGRRPVIRPEGTSGELEHAVRVEGSRPGNHHVRIRREDLGAFRRVGPDHLVATEQADHPTARIPGFVRRLQDTLIGRPLNSEAIESERLPILRALPILSSDALSSVAYGPEAALSVLAAAGAGALLWNVPIGIAVALLMLLVTASYRQVIRGYQGGGGSYAVARANLGLIFGLVAGAALLVDYVLTVSVSVSSGVDALASAFGALVPYRILIGLGFIALLTVGNLRGLREAGALFAGPTYLFVLSMLVLIVVGLLRPLLFGTGGHGVGHYAPIDARESLTPLLLLTAFASGCSSMTGIEAVSNSVPSFREPQARNAGRTLTLLGGMLVILFLGIVALDLIYGAEPHANSNPTVLSELASAILQGPLEPGFYVVQLATTLVLILAANTSFNGFPRLSAILARDDFLPHRFAQLGNRLVYSSAMVFLALAASALLIGFSGNTDALINLYALGVFTAFTLAQSGMARHWWLHRESGWRRSMLVNLTGATITFVVDAIIVVTKAPRGAWIVLIVVPALVGIFLLISHHYSTVRALLARAPTPQVIRGPIVVPALDYGTPTATALQYALGLGGDVILLHREGEQQSAWGLVRSVTADTGSVRLMPTPGRGRVRLCLDGLDQMETTGVDGQLLTVVIPEPKAPTLWREILFRPDLIWLKLALLHRPNVVAASLPTSGSPPAGPGRAQVAFVPLATLDAPSRKALAYAHALTPHVVAVHVATSAGDQGADSDRLRADFEDWQHRGGDTPIGHLVVIDSPYRSVVPPLLAYLDSWRRAHPEPIATVVLPEFLVQHWWQLGLHNHRAFWLKASLLRRSNMAVADVTYRLMS